MADQLADEQCLCLWYKTIQLRWSGGKAIIVYKIVHYDYIEQPWCIVESTIM